MQSKVTDAFRVGASLLVVLSVFTGGCTTGQIPGLGGGFGSGSTPGGTDALSSTQAGSVGLVDPSDRAHVDTQLHSGDYVALAENVTNEMLSSPFVVGWGTARPRLIVGTLLNNTDNENIRMSDVHDRIQETILKSATARVVDKSATAFDYIIKSEITSTRQYGQNNEELVHYTLQLKMFKLDGELVGQWSDDLAIARGKKKLF